MIITQTQLGVDLVGCPTVCTSDIGILDKSFISVMFIWLIWLPIHYLTQNPCFSIPFQLTSTFVIITQTKLGVDLVG